MTAHPAIDSAADSEALLAEVQSLAASVREFARPPIQPHAPPSAESKESFGLAAETSSPRTEPNRTFQSAAHSGIPATHVPRSRVTPLPLINRTTPDSWAC